MTKREQRLLILVGIVVTVGLTLNFLPRILNFTDMNGGIELRLPEANHLLRSRLNIAARNKAVTTELKSLQNRFLGAGNPENSKISLLKEVEELAFKSNLRVEQKNVTGIREDTIGVSLAGKATPEALTGFLYRAMQDKIGLRIQRLQIHSLPESKQLNYQITISTLLVE